MCAYHSGVECHNTEDYWTLKRAVENLIEQKKVVLRDKEVPNVTNNPLPAHNNGPIIGMICDDKQFDPALKAIITIADSKVRPRAAVKQARNEKKKLQLLKLQKKLWKQKKVTVNVPKLYVPKGTYVAQGPVISPRLTEPVVISRAPKSPMRDPTAVPWNYSKIVVTYTGKEIMGEVNEMNQSGKDQNPEELKRSKLNKEKQSPPKKPVSAEEAEEFFRKMKTSEYAIIDQLRKTPSQSNNWREWLNDFEVNRISFSRDDLPLEGAAHNKALHLTVKCEGYYVKRVMLDGASRFDICPLSTLQRMEIGTKIIRPSNVCVRAFDGVKRDTIREIYLILTIGPVDFEVTFQILDMDTSYNFLLGRPWVHAARVVPSTLHQIVKFEYENQEIVVREEDE
ncbi:PREDICTED: uncharacterized protein LOC109219980 [Nicotiana attenuata]|uniref:uncharacterized protein LOC109219980 n=1 Tax=Nicotiana attenuata TaxID=49451 RepID=UPI000904744E|nr:PREDICTED: uncharacterized protein LOC109219980 [Nicotiana attenuata]